MILDIQVLINLFKFYINSYLLELPLSTISAINPKVTQGQKQVTKPCQLERKKKI